MDAGPWLRGALDPQRQPGRGRPPGQRRRAIRAGVTLVNGTDIPPGDPVDGIPAAVHELLLMAAAGLSPLLSLQSVSINAAALLGIGDHVGQIRPGYAADFVAVVRTVVYLAPGASWQQAADAHRDVLGAAGNPGPANTMLYVAGLIGDGFLVEIEAQAVVLA